MNALEREQHKEYYDFSSQNVSVTRYKETGRQVLPEGSRQPPQPGSRCRGGVRGYTAGEAAAVWERNTAAWEHHSPAQNRQN